MGSVVPTGVSHTASRACKFQGYDIPEGVIVMPYVASAQHDPSVFPEPHQFRPERFLDDAGNLKMPVKYNPFGMGRLISGISINNNTSLRLLIHRFSKFSELLGVMLVNNSIDNL